MFDKRRYTVTFLFISTSAFSINARFDLPVAATIRCSMHHQLLEKALLATW
jgi:hypothetical protein